jgi:hypothetical protein
MSIVLNSNMSYSNDPVFEAVEKHRPDDSIQFHIYDETGSLSVLVTQGMTQAEVVLDWKQLRDLYCELNEWLLNNAHLVGE